MKTDLEKFIELYASVGIENLRLKEVNPPSTMHGHSYSLTLDPKTEEKFIDEETDYGEMAEIGGFSVIFFDKDEKFISQYFGGVKLF